MSDYEVSRRTVTGADPARVTALIADLHAWQAWSPWEGSDPELERSYTGPRLGPGAAYAWSGNRKAGAGRMQITDQVSDAQGDRVELALAFTRPMKSRASITFHVTPVEEGTEIVWRMTGPRTVAVRALGVIGGMDRMIGPDFERGLASLAVAAESGETS